MPLFKRKPKYHLLEGAKRLEVVGESFHRNNLDRIADAYEAPGPDTGFGVIATLHAEPNNPHDPNAVAVHVLGLIVGHLPADIAAQYQPAVIRLAAEHRVPPALRGFLNTGHGELIYSITLDHDPADFTTP